MSPLLIKKQSGYLERAKEIASAERDLDTALRHIADDPMRQKPCPTLWARKGYDAVQTLRREIPARRKRLEAFRKTAAADRDSIDRELANLELIEARLDDLEGQCRMAYLLERLYQGELEQLAELSELLKAEIKRLKPISEKGSCREWFTNQTRLELAERVRASLKPREVKA